MKVPSRSRSRSGLAWASCSSSIRAGSILGLTVIVVSFFESVVRDHSKDHAVAVVYFNDTHTAEPYTTLLDATRAPAGARRRYVELGRARVGASSYGGTRRGAGWTGSLVDEAPGGHVHWSTTRRVGRFSGRRRAGSASGGGSEGLSDDVER